MDDQARTYSCNPAAGDRWSWSYARFYAWRFI
jgi:hypothetical protein